MVAPPVAAGSAREGTSGTKAENGMPDEWYAVPKGLKQAGAQRQKILILLMKIWLKMAKNVIFGSKLQ